MNTHRQVHLPKHCPYKHTRRCICQNTVLTNTRRCIWQNIILTNTLHEKERCSPRHAANSDCQASGITAFFYSSFVHNFLFFFCTFYSLPSRFLYLFFCRFSIHLTICNLSYFLFYLLRQYLCTLTQAFSFMFPLYVPRFSIHKYILWNISSFAHTYYNESGDK